MPPSTPPSIDPKEAPSGLGVALIIVVVNGAETNDDDSNFETLADDVTRGRKLVRSCADVLGVMKNDVDWGLKLIIVAELDEKEGVDEFALVTDTGVEILEEFIDAGLRVGIGKFVEIVVEISGDDKMLAVVVGTLAVVLAVTLAIVVGVTLAETLEADRLLLVVAIVVEAFAPKPACVDGKDKQNSASFVLIVEGLK